MQQYAPNWELDVHYGYFDMEKLSGVFLLRIVHFHRTIKHTEMDLLQLKQSICFGQKP